MITLGQLAVLISTVSGIGRLPLAPGTWGSLVGLALGAVAAQLVTPAMAWVLLIGDFILGAWCCGLAEEELGRHDAPAIILDEVWGMSAVYILLPWTTHSVVLVAIAFLLFRAFDIIKPPPLRWLARLPGGWGIMADDLGAAAYAVAALLLIGRLTGAPAG